MSDLPLLQLSLNFVSLPAALAVALKIAGAVDVLEAGTPLCKSVGLEAIRAVREVCPDKLIYADFKTPDVGELEWISKWRSPAGSRLNNCLFSGGCRYRS